MARLIHLLIWALLAQTAMGQQNATLNVASYNLRYSAAQDGVNAWTHRKEMVKSLVRYHEFDIFGTQEGLIDQLDDLAAMKEFAFVGVGRDDGKQGGEHSAIFYRKSRFSLLQSGDYWLSQTPDRPSLGWDAVCCKRIASWAQFRDLVTGKAFFFFSVHFDHQGEQARRESAQLMVRKIKEIAGDAPVICAGDLNSTPETEQVKTLQTLLADAYRVSVMPAYGPTGTFNDFKLEGPLEARIDYIFVSDRVTVLKYAALTDFKERRFPSDHLPIVVKAEIR